MIKELEDVKLKNGESLVAVYGSLRKGHGNHTIISSGEYITNILVSGCAMYSGYAFPYVCYTGNDDDVIIAEVYKVNSETLYSLDGLEGISLQNDESGHYMRRKLGDSDIWMYFSCENATKLALPRVPNMSNLFNDDECKDMHFADWTVYKKQFIDNKYYTAPIEDDEYNDDVPQEGLDMGGEGDVETLGDMYSNEVLFAAIGEEDLKLLYKYSLHLGEYGNDIEYEEWKTLFIAQVKTVPDMKSLHQLIDECKEDFANIVKEPIGKTNDEYISYLMKTYSHEYKIMCKMSLFELNTIFNTYNETSDKTSDEADKEMQDLAGILIELKESGKQLPTNSGDKKYDSNVNMLRRNVSRKPFEYIRNIHQNPTDNWHTKYAHVIEELYKDALKKESRRLILSIQERIRKSFTGEKEAIIPAMFEELNIMDIDDLIELDCNFDKNIESMEKSLAV